MADEPVVLRDGTTIPDVEFAWHFSRSGGPGGQNVNKVSSKAELRFRPADSRALTDVQKARLATRLAGRLLESGELLVTSQTHRSQAENRRVCMKKLAAILDGALERKKTRIRTKPTKASKERRIGEKRKMGQKKSMRRSRPED